MTEQDSDHKQTIREAFTRQVETYSASERIANPEGRRAFVEFVDPPREASVLDIATGPGFMAFAFAERVRDVVGVDVTPAMLARAEAERARLGLINVRFQEGDAEALPFTDGSFDIVTCGSAFHHFLHPERILAEMVRVLRRGGTAAISDITTGDSVGIGVWMEGDEPHFWHTCVSYVATKAFP